MNNNFNYSVVRNFNTEDTELVAGMLRDEIIAAISKNGGHLASNLGVVELTLALNKAFDFKRDKIVWDVGHQSYTYKILTDRRARFSTIRKEGGLSGFPNIFESEYDAFGTGHATTSISAALGLAAARDLKGEDHHVIAVIGDGAMTGGMAYEAMNNASAVTDNLIVILNDNTMSINKNVGALTSHLSNIRLNPAFIKIRRDIRAFVKSIPGIGKRILYAAEKLEDHLTYLLIPGVFFESLGFNYLGPFDGHNTELLVETFEKAKKMEGNKLIHIVTQKGKGYPPAENNATKFHGTPPFDIKSGCSLSAGKKKNPSYTEVFGRSLVKIAEKNNNIIAITAAMEDGTGLREFAERFPKRFFDVGIAEQHAVTFAAAMAREGLRPIVAIYSTFLQRGFDQLIHDVALQKLPVVFAIDRAGIVGEDGATHQGMFDLSYLRLIPNFAIMAPSDELEFEGMLRAAFQYNGPIAIRYPRRETIGLPYSEELIPKIEVGKADLICEGKDVCIIAIGTTLFPAILATEKLNAAGIDVTLINARSLKPLDEKMILRATSRTEMLFTFEENSEVGGLGAAVSELLQRQNIFMPLKITGIPDRFIEHANQEKILADCMLNADGMARIVLEALAV